MNCLHLHIVFKKFQYKLFLVTLVFWSVPTISPSLMMSTDEISTLNSIAPEDIDSLIKVPEVPNLIPSTIEDVLFLSAILYFSPTHWTVWINEKTYTPDDREDNSLKILTVNNHYIELELKETNRKIIKLRSNQSLITVGNQIVDGDARQKQAPIQL